MKSKYNIKLTDEKRDEMISAIKNYFSTQRNEKMDDSAAGMILDFIMKELAPEFYNQGVYDIYKFMDKKIEELLVMQKMI